MSQIAFTAFFLISPLASAQEHQQARCEQPRRFDERGLSMTGIGADLRRRWSDCRDALLELRSLGEDWDGDGAYAPMPGIIDSIIALIQSDEGQRILRTPPDDISPLRDGTIALEWHRPTSDRVVMRFDSPVKAQVITMSPGMPTASFWQDFSTIA